MSGRREVYVRTVRDGRNESVSTKMNDCPEVRRLALEHSGRTTATVELVESGPGREPGPVLARYRNGERTYSHPAREEPTP